jgi:hypothetical protein
VEPTHEGEQMILAKDIPSGGDGKISVQCDDNTLILAITERFRGGSKMCHDLVFSEENARRLLTALNRYSIFCTNRRREMKHADTIG